MLKMCVSSKREQSLAGEKCRGQGLEREHSLSPFDDYWVRRGRKTSWLEKEYAGGGQSTAKKSGGGSLSSKSFTLEGRCKREMTGRSNALALGRSRDEVRGSCPAEKAENP